MTSDFVLLAKENQLWYNTDIPQIPKGDIPMKKLLSMLLVLAALLGMLAGCGNVGGIEEDGGLSESEMAVLLECGFSEEEIENMPAEEIEMILLELGLREEAQQQPQETQPQQTKPKSPTAEDVQQGGSYTITIGDSMLWNYYVLYYEDGKLVKIEYHFQKSSEEEPEEGVIEGEDVKTYSFNWVNFYDATPQEIIDMLTGYGYTYLSIRPVG